MYMFVPKRRANRHTVREALNNELWLEGIQGNLCVDALMDYLDLWDIQMYLVNLGTSQMKLLHVDYKMLNSISFGSARSPPSGENIM
jgi:hypothetical protein